MSNKTLFLFTIRFPFGDSEGFIYNEIPYLARKFDTIVIIPSENREKEAHSVLPSNCIVDSSLTQLNRTFTFRSFLGFAPGFLKIWLFSLIFSKDSWKYLRFIKGAAHHYFNDMVKYQTTRTILLKYQKVRPQLLAYDYWLLNSSLSLIKCKNDGLLDRIICRAHGFDLYKERHTGGFLPFVEYKLKHISRIFTVSEHGKKYLQREFGGNRPATNVEVRYLGINADSEGVKPNIPQPQFPVIVSCSGIIPVKRVEMIARAVLLCKKRVTWIHFGDGPLRNSVEELVIKTEKNKQIIFAGHCSNKSILSFYRSIEVSAFISASSSEGLPVSMMEAQAFGIPIIAPNLNGIPEIVNSETGILYDQDIEAKKLAELIDDIISNSEFSKNRIRKHYLQHFSAELNYDNFALELAELAESPSS
jgi:glycosyltransferase involved in cell wall biosynthesis